MSNGLVLLIVGSAITYYLVPEFQNRYEKRQQQLAAMQDCFAQFLIYSNSIWQEYYAILPLTQRVEIDQDIYLQYVDKISNIKLKRYDAYAKVQALSVAFLDKTESTPEFSIIDGLTGYARTLNFVSESIDKWLTGLYCTPTKRERSPCAQFDLNFDAFGEYTTIKNQVLSVGNEKANTVAGLMMKKINQH